MSKTASKDPTPQADVRCIPSRPITRWRAHKVVSLHVWETDGQGHGALDMHATLGAGLWKTQPWAAHCSTAASHSTPPPQGARRWLLWLLWHATAVGHGMAIDTTDHYRTTTTTPTHPPTHPPHIHHLHPPAAHTATPGPTCSTFWQQWRQYGRRQQQQHHRWHPRAGEACHGPWALLSTSRLAAPLPPARGRGREGRQAQGMRSGRAAVRERVHRGHFETQSM